MYLEPIFGRGALPREQERFKRVDDDFRLIILSVLMLRFLKMIFRAPNIGCLLIGHVVDTKSFNGQALCVNIGFAAADFWSPGISIMLIVSSGFSM